MTKEVYETAKHLMDQKDGFKTKMYELKKMTQRSDDTEFNRARQLAYDSLSSLCEMAQRRFDAL